MKRLDFSNRKLKVWYVTILLILTILVSVWATAFVFTHLSASANLPGSHLNVEIYPKGRPIKAYVNQTVTLTVIVHNGTSPYTFKWMVDGSEICSQQMLEFVAFTQPSDAILILTVEVSDFYGSLGYDATMIIDPATINIYLDDIPCEATYTVKTDGTNVWAVRLDGYKASESTTASTVFSYVRTQMASTGGEWSITKGVYDLTEGNSIVGTGTPPLGVEVTAKTWVVHGEGRWTTVLRAQVDMNIFEFSNALSIKLSDMYLNMNYKNGYAIRGLDTGVSDRSLMRSEINNIEIHGVVSPYYGIYLTNPYFINSYKLIYIRGANGLMFDCTATGYGNQYLENIFISLNSENGKGVYFKNAGAGMGENSIYRLHVDGNNYATGNVGIQLYGSNYNTFYYPKLEKFGSMAVYIEPGAISKSNTFNGGYVQMNGGTAFNFSAEYTRGNRVKDFHVSAAGTITLIDDGNDTPGMPDVFEDVISDYPGTINVLRDSSSACLLKGVIGWNTRGEDGDSETIANGQTSVTVAHNFVVTPIYILATGGHSETSDCYVTGINATHFVINVPVAVTASRTVYWWGSVNAQSTVPP